LAAAIDSAGSTDAGAPETAGTAGQSPRFHEDPTAPIAANIVAPRSGAGAIGSRSLENVAVWVNEGGAGGGYSMKALRTLVVEDDAMIGGLLAETLEGLGHTVCAVESDVTNAVAAASHWRPDLMIVDVGLSEASGAAAVKEIVRIKFVPNVFVTGNAVRGTPLGPETVLIQKPFRVSDLERAIQRALATARACNCLAEQSEKDG
jgi:two-component system, response regulator PdtaR